MDEIWIAIHRMANVLETLHGRAGVVMDSPEEDRKREKLQRLLKIADDMNTIWGTVPTIFKELTGVEWPMFESHNPTDLSADSWGSWKAVQYNNVRALANAINNKYRDLKGDYAEIWIDLVKVKIPRTVNSIGPLRYLNAICAYIEENIGTPYGQRIKNGSMQYPGEIYTKSGVIDTLLENCNNFITENIQPTP